MLVNETNPKLWEMDFKETFRSFSIKCPVQLSMYLKIQDGEMGAVVKHINSGSIYFFPLDYEKSVKDFIADIKKVLVANHYPRLIQSKYEKYEKTPEELAADATAGISAVNLKSYGLKEVSKTFWHIDKIFQNNQACLVVDKTNDPELQEGDSFIYQYDKAILIFLKNYRGGKYASIDEAAEEFFSNSKVVKKLVKKESK